jgi:STE24 endopeptidase
VTARGSAFVALLLLGVALAVAIGVTTPWAPLKDGGGRSAVATEPAHTEPARDFTAAEQAREDRFNRAARTPQHIGLVVGLVVAAALGLSPLGARLAGWAGTRLGSGWTGHWTVRLTLAVVVLALLARLVALPFDARTVAVRRRYGLYTQSWWGWLGDVAKGWALNTGLLVLALLALYALARAFPRTWWAPAALGGAGLVLALSFLYPIVVEPVFNSFEPMAEGPLRTSLLQLAADDGVVVSDVLVADASRRTTALNAYVSGYGATRRIVVYDTLVDGATPAEIRNVVAHELGHADEDDVLNGTLIGALGVAAAVCLLFLVLTSRPLLHRAGVDSLSDPRSVALVLLAVTVLSTASGPLQMLVSRRVEARADVHALELTQDAPTFAAMQRRLAVTNLSDLDPSPLQFGLFSSHPTAPQRIALARAWAASAGAPVPADLAPQGAAR